MNNISIIVLTHNREDLILNCLKRIYKDLEEKDEIIIIDNNSSDNTRKILKDYSRKSKVSVYFSNENTGVSIGRNLGAKLSKNELLAFIDSDIILNENSLSYARQNFKISQYAAMVGIYNEIGDGYNWHVEMNRELFASKRKNDFKSFINYKNYTTFSGGLCLIRKDIFLKYKGYNIDFTGIPSEDINFELQLIRDKQIIYFEKNFSATHYKNKLSFKDLLKRSWKSGIGVSNLIKFSLKEKYKIPFNEQWPYLPIIVPLEIVLLILSLSLKSNYLLCIALLLILIRSISVISKKCRTLIYRIRFLYIRIVVDFTMFISMIIELFKKRKYKGMTDVKLEKINE